MWYGVMRHGVCACDPALVDQVLRTAFKKGKFDSSSTEQLQMLDPFLPLLTVSLASRHTKVLTHSLHCLLPLLRLSLPSLHGSVNLMVAALFGVLRKYARSGEMSGTNRELVVAAFKVAFYFFFHPHFSCTYTPTVSSQVFLLLKEIHNPYLLSLPFLSLATGNDSSATRRQTISDLRRRT